MFDIEIDSKFIVDYNKSVLIVIDMIKGFTDVGNLNSNYISSIASDIKYYSKKFSNIVAINDSHNMNDCEFNFYPHHCMEGTIESEFCEELKSVDFDYVLSKNSTNAFFSNGFLSVFNSYIENNFNFVVVGCCADICVLQFCLTFKAYLNHINKNLDIIIPVNLIETYDDINHPRDEVLKISLYLMKNMGIKLMEASI